jgi:hypothetical protein
MEEVAINRCAIAKMLAHEVRERTGLQISFKTVDLEIVFILYSQSLLEI